MKLELLFNTLRFQFHILYILTSRFFSTCIPIEHQISKYTFKVLISFKKLHGDFYNLFEKTILDFFRVVKNCYRYLCFVFCFL